MAARAVGVPGIVNTVHGLYATAEDPLPRRAVVYALERVAAACSDVELVQNPDDLATLRRLGVPDDRLVLLGNGVDLERFQPRRKADDIARARRELGLDPSAVVAGTVGRLVWGKGFKELFAAAGRMRTLRPEVVFVVVGPIDKAKGDALTDADVAEAIALGNVVFTGHRNDVQDLYPGFDLFVLPSYREGFPRSAMEAAASGLPVIATDIRGCRQVVDPGVNGLLVPLHDVDALTTAIAELSGDPARRGTMGARSRAKAESEFDDRRVIKTTLDAYRRLPMARTSRRAR
jgi:glycosyltransferase involved in cell wall biosynthesis